MDERLAPETIVDGRYRVVERIGSGGMADVYRAEDLQLGRDVALKILHRRFSEDEEFVERFRREASSAAGLQHPNVVSVYDRGAWDGTYYIAMEHVEGQTLKQVVHGTNPPTPQDPATAVELAIQILRAAKFAHKRGVIHRDLKPHNVIVDGEGRAKVTDFGIALAGVSDMTQTGSIMGTAQYLSPEQAQGHPVTGQSDLYAIGVILFELLTGRIPFDGDSAVTIALKQVNEPATPPSAYNPAVGPDLDAVVLRALEKDPARRFADADAFIAALEQVAERLASGSAGSTGVTSVAGAAVATAYGLPPAETGLSQHTQVSGAIPQVSAYDGYAYPTTAPPEPPQDDRGSRRWWVALLAGLLVAAAIVGGLLLLGGDKVTVPQVVGVDEASAVTRLRADGFNTDITTKNDPNAPKGQVIGQIPNGGSEADKGSTVTLTVSDGPGNATVPRVVGQGRNAATKALREAGFLVREETAFSAEIGENRVISVEPGQGESLEKGSTVTITVSEGAERAAVPNVVDQNRDDAETTLEDAGFTVSVREQESDEEVGTVLAQNPAGGTSRPKGSRVTITVAKEAEEVDVPDVTGQTSAEATAALSGAGFTVVPREQEVDSPDQDGVVLAQDPKDGKLRKGQRVTITVGAFSPDLNPDPTPTPTPTPTATP
ncbi:Stk1 family PASTA domain-containing Ser/Thr kinase [Conexibacter sp. W3-3-2]|uniref:Stk1 family PASTA domain-containing Ser/Thr kinase n=1 Tax=Conexibacter sp. W3-3-2 TaxID=2675227 RepID=UPI0012B78268|nr:Stk1 family PASTA domain-containing Ser/Thr kinase [Conexibacter sp. W3-3-2]MTD45525.1 Stk1 family PASTA domain-containing Ser/Thr kinase [Conexibacter sp. W3-3-2]